MEKIILFSFLVAVDDDILMGFYFLIGQLPGLLDLVLVADLVVFEIDRLIAVVVQLYP